MLLLEKKEHFKTYLKIFVSIVKVYIFIYSSIQDAKKMFAANNNMPIQQQVPQPLQPIVSGQQIMQQPMCPPQIVSTMPVLPDYAQQHSMGVITAPIPQQVQYPHQQSDATQQPVNQVESTEAVKTQTPSPAPLKVPSPTPVAPTTNGEHQPEQHQASMDTS